METRRSIVVTNLPDLNKKKLKDKLEIHFGKRGNGGGDVDQIVITEQCGLIGTVALITFAEKETVASVMGKQHIFFEKTLTVEPHPFTEEEQRNTDHKSSFVMGKQHFFFEKTLTVEPHSSTEEEQCNTDHNASKKIRLSRLPQLPSQDLKLIIHGRYADDVLQSTAERTNAALQVDDKSTKFCLEGPPPAIVEAVDILGKHNTTTTTQPHGSGNDGQRKNIANWTASLERHVELIEDKKALKISSVVGKQSDADPLKIVKNSPGSPRKDVSKLERKRNKLPANTKKLSRNIAKFDPKILSYIQAVQHRMMTEAGDRFHVDFEAKADGEVEFKSRGQNTDQQRINESMKFLKNLVSSIQKMGFVTEIVGLMQFREVPKQKVDEAVEQTLKSTDALVTRKAINTLEFYGTEHGVHHEIEKLRAGILGRDLQTDSQGDIEQTVYNQTNGDGTQFPCEEMGNMAMVGNFRAENYSKHPKRLASLGEDITDEASSAQGVQFKKWVDAPARKPLVRPLVTLEGSSVLDDVQLCFAENVVDGETYLSPEGPPTWREESYPSLPSVTYDKICYPPNKAKEENQASKQSWHPVDLATYFNDESLPDEQNRSSDIVSEQEVETAKPKVTFVCMNQAAHSAPMERSHVQGATQDEDDEDASRSCQNGGSTKMVDMSLDEVDGARALFMTNGARSEILAMEPSPSCFPSEESSGGRDSPMEIDPISQVNTSAAVPSPWSPWLVGWPPVDHSLGGASPVGISTGGIPDLYDIKNQSEDFTVAIRTGMKVILRPGDITNEFADVIVTSADSHLSLKDGVGRAIRDAAGQELVIACQRWITKNGPVDHGKNVWTVGGNLKCSHVLHVVLKQSQGEMPPGRELKKTFIELLKTCSHSLQASHVSMPAIGLEKLSVSKKVWARAFFEAVCEITQLYDKGWMQLSTLVLVDRNRALIREVKKVFENPILSGSHEGSSHNIRQEHPLSRSREGSSQNIWQGSPLPGSYEESFLSVWQESSLPGVSNSFTESNDASNVPQFRARGPSKVQNKASSRGVRNNRSGVRSTQSVNWQSSYQTSTRKDSSGVKSAFMDDLPVDDDHKCAICLGRIKKEKKLRCKHSFCRQCVDEALKVHKYCPICKQPV